MFNGRAFTSSKKWLNLQNETLEPTAGPWPGVEPVIKNQSSFRRQPSRAQQPQLMRPRQPWPSGWQWITTFIGVFAEQWAGTVAYRRVDARSRQRGAGGPLARPSRADRNEDQILRRQKAIQSGDRLNRILGKVTLVLEDSRPWSNLLRKQYASSSMPMNQPRLLWGLMSIIFQHTVLTMETATAMAYMHTLATCSMCF